MADSFEENYSAAPGSSEISESIDFKKNESSSPNAKGKSVSFEDRNLTTEVDEKRSDEVLPESSTDDPEWLDILGSGHLKKKIIVKGEDDTRPHRGDSIIVDIVGMLEDGVEFEKRNDFEMCVGDAEVIQGIEYSLPLMNTGETAELSISPRFGYGSLGDLPRVPKDANLKYVVTLKEIKGVKDASLFTVDDRLTVGMQKKERGNWWYQRKEYNLAIQCYRKALQFFEEDLSETNASLNEAKLNTYNNLSIAHFNIEAYDAALNAVNNVLSQDPGNIKAIYRKVKILKAQGEIEDAISVAKKGLKSKPDSPALQDELNILIEIKKKSTSAQKVLYRKMFKTSDDDKDKEKNKRTLLSITWKWLGIITVAVGIIGAAAVKYRY